MMRIAASFLALIATAMPAAAANVTIGAVYPDGDARRAVAVALDIVNGAHDRMPVLMGQGGGLDRLGGATLAAAYADDESDPAKATAAAERLLAENGAVALIGGTTDATEAAISRVAEKHGVPFFALNGTLTNTDGLFWFFRLGRTPALDARGLFRLLGTVASANGMSLATVGLAGEGAAGRDGFSALRTAGEAAGLRVVDVPLPAGSPTPDLVVSWGVPATPIPGAVSIVLATPGDPGKLAEDTFRVTSYTDDPIPARPGVSAVASAFQASAGKPLTATTAREITGVLLLADVINRAASTKPIDLRTALMATDTPGSETLMLWDGIRFDDSGQNVLASPALQQMQGGTLQVVAPDAIATAPPAWPKR